MLRERLRADRPSPARQFDLSSFQWRHVLGAGATSSHSWIAPDLIGMGGSNKPDIGYLLADHIEFIEAFVDVLGLDDRNHWA